MLSSMEVVVLDEKDAGDWVYRGEGAANIVLSYTGSSPLFVSFFLFLFYGPMLSLCFRTTCDVFFFGGVKRLSYGCFEANCFVFCSYSVDAGGVL